MKNHFAVAILLGLTLIFALSNTAAAQGKGKYSKIKLRVSTGKSLPSIGLRTLDGKTANSSSQLKDNRKTIIFVWGTWCQACSRALPALEKLKSEFANAGVDLIGVALDYESDAPVAELIKEKKITYPMFIGGAGAAEKLYTYYPDDIAVPLFILLDEKGKVTFTGFGWAEDSQRAVLNFAGVDFDVWLKNGM